MTRHRKYISFLDSWLECKACGNHIMCDVHSRWVRKLLVRSQAKLVTYGSGKDSKQPKQVLTDECNA